MGDLHPCEECGQRKAAGIHRTGRHHLAHVVINRRVRAGWVPITDEVDVLPAFEGRHVETEGEHCRRRGNSPYQWELRPIWWATVEDAEDVAAVALASGSARELICVGHVLRDVLLVAARVRAGMPWWLAWRVRSMHPDLVPHALDAARCEPPIQRRGDPLWCNP